MTMNTMLPLPVGPRADSPLRLTLTPAGPWSRLNGAWWPRSGDLSAELPSLIIELDRSWGRITRAAVHGPAWSGLHHDQPTGSHCIHVSWYDTAQDPHAISLYSYRIGSWELLVVPPATDPRRAELLMAAAARPGNHQAAATLLADGPERADVPYRGRIRVRTWHGRGATGPGLPMG